MKKLRLPSARPRMRAVPIRWLAVACLLTTTGCRGGCSRQPGSRSAGGTPAATLAQLPAESQVVVSVDFQRIRATQLWQRISTLASEDPDDRRLIQEFTARTGLDPFRQIHRLTAAFPEEARKSQAFGVIIEGEGFDEKRLLTYARDQARLRGTELKPRRHGPHTLWETGAPGGAAGFFLGRGRFVLAGGGWAEKMSQLTSEPSRPGAGAESNTTLLRLVEQLGVKRSIWMAALVPDETRARLRSDPRFGTQASVMRFGLGLDLGPGLQGELDAELSNAEDARALVDRFQGFLRAARKSPEALLVGAGPYLDRISSQATGPRALVRVNLDEAQTAELIQRLVGLLRLQREKK
jgi:hypothetical protein